MNNQEHEETQGYVDLQVNGHKGVDFSSEELTEDSFIYACQELGKCGTAVFLPTIITSPPSLLKRNLSIMARVMEKAEFRTKLPGFHIEGPFLSAQDGARGAHNKEWVIPPNTALLNDMQEWSGGRIRLVTIAAETEGAVGFCSYATSKGIVVSMGHQLATTKEVDALAEAGATALTHLGNGIPQKIDRHQNPIWAGLANDKLKAMIIPDGHHIPDTLIRVILKVKGIENTIVVSDASPIAGLPPGTYNTLGNEVILSETGKLYNPETGYLVGSSATMQDCMNHLLSRKIVTPEEAYILGVVNPSKLIS